MPKDYRKRKVSRAPQSSNSFAWAIFGILIGVFLAIVFYWQQRTPSDSQHHVASTKTGVIAKHVKHLAVAPKKPVAPAAPEFDFYTVLPKMQVSSNNPTPAASPAAHRPPVTPEATIPASAVAPTVLKASSPPSLEEGAPPPPVAKSAAAVPTSTPTSLPTLSEKKPSAVKESESGSYLLQMASLKNYADADRLKAQLTMLGFDVYIHSYSANGQVYNRVVMGPYSSRAAASHQQIQLQKNHVPSILIKAP